MEIHQLEYVLAVVKHHHFSQAAESICICQSTLSHQINKLEGELGVRLFDRTTRRVNLTPAGKEFAAHAANIIAELQLTKYHMQQYVVLEQGKIKIGAIPILGMLGLTSIIAAFQKSHPDVHLEILEDASNKVLETLLTAEIDVAFLTPPQNYAQYTNIQFYPLISDKLVVIVNQDHPIAKKRTIDLATLKDERYICMKLNYGMRRISINACHNAGFNPNIVYETSQVETISSLVGEGLGIALLTSRVAMAVQNPSISIVNLYNAPKRVTALAILQQDHLSPVVTAFRKFTLDKFSYPI